MSLIKQASPNRQWKPDSRENSNVIHKLYVFLHPQKTRDKRLMPWSELIHFLMGNRFATVPLQSVMLVFMWQSISELVTSIYGLHLVTLNKAQNDLLQAVDIPSFVYHPSIFTVIFACLSPFFLILLSLFPFLMKKANCWSGNWYWEWLVLQKNAGFTNIIFTSTVGVIAVFFRLGAAAIAKEDPQNRAFFAGVAFGLFLIYFPACLLSGGISPNRIEEEER
jgi:hypothetical protein